MPASQLNGWLKIIAGTVAGALFGAGVAWGALTASLDAHERSKGHPRLVEEVDALKEAMVRAEERQRYIREALERIEKSLAGG